jgi:DNA-binding Lrp family transcriptional regulator
VLDAVDTVLVRELREDGRATFQALADHVGLSRTAVRARVQSLLEQRVVRVVGVVHSSVVGTGAIGYIFGTLDGAARPVAERVAARSAVHFASLTAGSHPFVAEVRTRDDKALSGEVDEIRRTSGVRAAEVFRAVSVVKDAYSIADEIGDTALDEIDWRLLRELQRDGRASFTRLARTIELSQAATRARVVRLLRAGVIRVTGIPDPTAFGVSESAAFGLVTTGAVRPVADRISALTGVNYAVTGFGRHDILGHVEAPSGAGLVGVLDAIRAVPGVAGCETWHHLDIVKDSHAAELPDKPGG